MLSLLETARALAHDPEVLEAAIWFHDAIYEPGAHDNEVMSARLAIETLRLAGWDRERTDRVGVLIMYTAQHRAPEEDRDAALLLDLDLSILGADSATYALYVRQVRKEYPHLTDHAFDDGRLGFLNQMLQRPALFLTDHFSSLLEATARRNLRHELNALIAQHRR